MKKVIEEVFEFNKRILEVEKPAKLRELSDAEKQFAYSCFIEEMHELDRSHSPVDQIDALIDMLYFAIGRGYRLGYSVSDLCADIAASWSKIKNSFVPETVFNIMPRKVKPLDRPLVQNICKRQMNLANSLLNTKGVEGQSAIICELVSLSLFAMYKMNLTADQTRHCILLVDRSNKMKKIGLKKGRSGEVDAVKSEGFISPENQIAQYLGL